MTRSIDPDGMVNTYRVEDGDLTCMFIFEDNDHHRHPPPPLYGKVGLRSFGNRMLSIVLACREKLEMVLVGKHHLRTRFLDNPQYNLRYEESVAESIGWWRSALLGRRRVLR